MRSESKAKAGVEARGSSEKFARAKRETRGAGPLVRVLADPETVGARRLSFTYALLDRAAHLVFPSTGVEKSAILAEVLEGAEDPERLPAQAVKPSAGSLTWIVDGGAAARLTRPPVKRG